MPELTVNGQVVHVTDGSVLRALQSTGTRPSCDDQGGNLRGPLCGMGVCMECRAYIDGHLSRTCLTPAREGMRVETSEASAARDLTPTAPKPPRHPDVLIIGAGPAGLEAALASAASGGQVTVIDANPAPGGQIWRGAREASPSDAGRLIRDVRAQPNVRLYSATQVLSVEGPRTIRVRGPFGVHVFQPRSVILATGASEAHLPFPGWTLPGVTGVGALQAMVKSGLDVRGKRVLIAGSGPLLLAAAHDLRQRGARVVGIAEQASPAQLLRFALHLPRHLSKAAHASTLLAGLQGVPYWTGAYPLRARGEERLERVDLRRGAREWSVRVDHLAVGYHLTPEVHLAQALGCELTDEGTVRVNAYGATSAPGVYAAGELTGVGGADKARVEGRLAGCAATAQVARLHALADQAASWRAFARLLERTFRVRPELRRVPQDDTVVCRCEGVTHAQLQSRRNWVDAKLHTRCGMGACQGRVCGPAARVLYGWGFERGRPPLIPTRIADLLEEA